jgi:hypothetical protein
LLVRMWEASKQLTKTFLIDSTVVKGIEVFNFLKGIDDMFNFFTDIKNRLASLEADVKVIYNHLFNDKATPTVPVEAPKAAEDAKQE